VTEEEVEGKPSRYSFDTDIEKTELEQVLGINSNRFYELKKEGTITPSGRKEGRTIYYWALESVANYILKNAIKGKQSSSSLERREVQNSLDSAREEMIQHELSIKRGETAPTALMREVISRAHSNSRNIISGIKPVIRSKYDEEVDPTILDNIDEMLNSACEQMSDVNLDDLINTTELIDEDD